MSMGSPEAGTRPEGRNMEVELRYWETDKDTFTKTLERLFAGQEPKKPTVTLTDKRWEVEQGEMKTTARIRKMCRGDSCTYEYSIKVKVRGASVSDEFSAVVNTEAEALEALRREIKDRTIAVSVDGDPTRQNTRERTQYEFGNSCVHKECIDITASIDVFTHADGVEFKSPLHSIEFEILLPLGASETDQSAAKERIKACAEKFELTVTEGGMTKRLAAHSDAQCSATLS